MRILLWSTTFWPHIGGVEVLGAHFVEALRDRGHEVTVLARRDTPDVPGESEVAGVLVVRRPFRQAVERRAPGPVATERAAVAALKERVRPDVLHLYHLGPDLLFHRLTRAVFPAPTVVTLHQAFTGRLFAPDVALGRTLREASWIAACSNDVLADLRRRIPAPGPPGSTIPNSLPMPALVPAPLPHDPPVVVMVGRVVAQKGFDLGLRAMARVAASHAGLRVVVAGDGIDRPALERLADELGLGSAVRFLGWVGPERVPALMNAGTVVLMPSRFEPYGLVALQAAQMGRPVAGFGVGGLPEVVADGETGRLVEAGDVDGLAAAVTELLDDPCEAARLGRAGRARHRTGWEEHVSAYEALYARLVGAEGRAAGGASEPPGVRRPPARPPRAR